MFQRKFINGLLAAALMVSVVPSAWAAASGDAPKADTNTPAAKPQTTLTLKQKELYVDLALALTNRVQQMFNLTIASLSNNTNYLFENLLQPTSIEQPGVLQASIRYGQTSNEHNLKLQQLILQVGLNTRLSQTVYLASILDTGVLGRFVAPDTFTQGTLSKYPQLGYQQSLDAKPNYLGFSVAALYVHPLANIEGVTGVRNYFLDGQYSGLSLVSKDPKVTEVDGIALKKFDVYFPMKNRFSGSFVRLLAYRNIESSNSRLTFKPSFGVGAYWLKLATRTVVPSTRLIRVSLGGEAKYQLNDRVNLVAQVRLSENFTSLSSGGKKNVFGYQFELGGSYHLNPQAQVQVSLNQFGLKLDGIQGYQLGVNLKYEF